MSWTHGGSWHFGYNPLYATHLTGYSKNGGNESCSQPKCDENLMINFFLSFLHAHPIRLEPRTSLSLILQGEEMLFAVKLIGTLWLLLFFLMRLKWSPALYEIPVVLVWRSIHSQINALCMYACMLSSVLVKMINFVINHADRDDLSTDPIKQVPFFRHFSFTSAYYLIFSVLYSVCFFILKWWRIWLCAQNVDWRERLALQNVKSLFTKKASACWWRFYWVIHVSVNISSGSLLVLEFLL